jgi:hypothetical protein
MFHVEQQSVSHPTVLLVPEPTADDLPERRTRLARRMGVAVAQYQEKRLATDVTVAG